MRSYLNLLLTTCLDFINLMKKQFSYLLLVGMSFLLWSCEKPEADEEKLTSFKNTLHENLGGIQGPISEYFYNFENELNAEFFRYNPNLMSNYGNYTDYYNLFGEDPPKMNYHTFRDKMLSMTPDDELEFTQRHYIDSLSVQDSIVPDSVLMRSTPFKNLESLEWNLEAEPSLQRYKLVNSDWVLADSMLFYNDTFDVSAYWAIVDTPFIDDGILFVDSAEWNDTNYVFYTDEQLRFITTFEFTKQQLSDDSLVFRINTDCNDNGVLDGSEAVVQDYNGDGNYEILYEYSDNNENGEYDAGDDIIQDYDGNTTISVAYEFVDTGNGIWDPAEPFYDINEDGEYDLAEPYQDRNCNNLRDAAEAFVDSDGSGTYTDGEDFSDTGNRIFDEEEEFTLKDLNNDGVDETYLYLIGEKPNNLIVDWADPENPVVLLEIVLGDSITSRWGQTYTNIIEEVDFYDLKQQYVDNVDSLVSLYTKEKVGHISGSSLSEDDYYITKSEWTQSAGGSTEKFYNYHIFHEPNHLNQVVYPAYFLPVGFYFNPSQMEDGFWHKNKLESEVLYYTYNGLLRDGEQIDTSYYDTTSIAVYFIEKSYQVESASVTVPAGRRISEDEPAVDTTFTDCFKVTQTTTMTMMGSGVDFGQRTETWLAKGQGLVKSEIHVRWTEHPYDSDLTLNGPPDENNEAWVGLNRIELTSLDISAGGGIFRKMTTPVEMIELRDIGNHPDFNFEPFRVSTQKGIQTLDFRELRE